MNNLFKIRIPENRNFGLDLLRFIAIFTVLVSHSITVLPAEYYVVHKFITDGVLIFFVLSGFLIGRILIRDFEEGITLSKMLYFWKRRWWRTLPAYYFTIFLILILSFILKIGFNKYEFLKTALFIQNTSHSPNSFFVESWSLSIEEWFYLSLPIFLLIFNRIFKLSIKKNIIFSFVLILIISNIIRFYYYLEININSLDVWDNNIRKTVITRLDSILIGVLTAWIFHFKRKFFDAKKNILFVIGLSIFLINKIFFDYFLSFNFYTCVLYFTLIPASISMMLPKFFYLTETKSRFFNNIIIKGSLISYSMYLINLTVISFSILKPLPFNMWSKFFLFWILTILGSILMYKYVETPFMRLRDKKKFKEKVVPL